MNEEIKSESQLIPNEIYSKIFGQKFNAKRKKLIKIPLTTQDVFNKYIMNGTKTQLQSPKIQRVLYNYELVEPLINNAEFITNKALVTEIINNDILKNNELYGIIQCKLLKLEFERIIDQPTHKVAKIYIVEHGHNAEMLIGSIFSIKDKEGMKQYRNKLKQLKSAMYIIYTKANKKWGCNIKQIKCILKYYPDTDNYYSLIQKYKTISNDTTIYKIK